MFRLANTSRCIKLASDSFCSNYTNLQIVRWRKPRWIPTAKSKLFKVPPRLVIPEDEKLELQRLYNNYRTEIKSIRRYLTNKYCTRFLASEDPEEQKRIFLEDFNSCMEINGQWNAQQKEIREKRVNEELASNIEFARKRMEMELLKEAKKMEVVEEIVRKEKEDSKNFITPENIDAAIEYALSNTIDYNFAINMNGEKITNQESKLDERDTKVSINN